MPRGFKSLAPLVAQAADSKKGDDIVLYDVHRVSGITDFLLLVSVGSPAQLEAVETAIEEVMDLAGVALIHRDGSASDLWRVLDYGGIMVHLMHPRAREFYALEKLYHDATRRRWEPAEAKRPAGRAR